MTNKPGHSHGGTPGATNEHQRKLTAGWIIISLCGVFACMNGLYSYGSTLLSVMNPLRPWATGAGSTSLTLTSIRTLNSELGPYWVLVNLVAWVNLTFTGLVLALAGFFGVRRREKWGWKIAFVVWFWVGINDTLGVITVYQMTGILIPTAPIPTTLGAIGLALSYRGVFSSKIH